MMLLMLLLASTGCETIHGMVTGMGQDIHNVTDPDKNGVHALAKADEWVKKNMW